MKTRCPDLSILGAGGGCDGLGCSIGIASGEATLQRLRICLSLCRGSRASAFSLCSAAGTGS
jgi:hypothetical protein